MSSVASAEEFEELQLLKYGACACSRVLHIWKSNTTLHLPDDVHMTVQQGRFILATQKIFRIPQTCCKLLCPARGPPQSYVIAKCRQHRTRSMAAKAAGGSVCIKRQHYAGPRTVGRVTALRDGSDAQVLQQSYVTSSKSQCQAKRHRRQALGLLPAETV